MPCSSLSFIWKSIFTKTFNPKRYMTKVMTGRRSPAQFVCFSTSQNTFPTGTERDFRPEPINTSTTHQRVLSRTTKTSIANTHEPRSIAYINLTLLIRVSRPAISRSTRPVTTSAASCQRLARNFRNFDTSSDLLSYNRISCWQAPISRFTKKKAWSLFRLLIRRLWQTHSKINEDPYPTLE